MNALNSQTQDRMMKEAEITASSPLPAHAFEKEQKTAGEKLFKALRFGVAEVTILVMSAVMAYGAKYGTENKLLKPVVSFLKSTQEIVDKKLKVVLPGAEESFKGRLRSAASNSFVLGWGGNIFAPVLYGIEKQKGAIISFFNRRLGVSEEAQQQASERIKKEGMPTLLDVVVGRIKSYVLVFAGFFIADSIAGKDKNTGIRRFRATEDYIGRKFSGHLGNPEILSEATRTAVPFGVKGANKKLDDLGLNDTAYKFGRLLSLDVIATTFAVGLWLYNNAKSAAKKAHLISAQAELVPVVDQASPTPDAVTHMVTETGAPPAENATAFAARETRRPESHVLAQTARAAAAAEQPKMMGI